MYIYDVWAYGWWIFTAYDDILLFESILESIVVNDIIECIDE